MVVPFLSGMSAAPHRPRPQFVPDQRPSNDEEMSFLLYDHARSGPELQHKPSNGNPQNSAAKVLYECAQCGHTEESFTKPAPVPHRG